MEKEGVGLDERGVTAETRQLRGDALKINKKKLLEGGRRAYSFFLKREKTDGWKKISEGGRAR